MIHKELDRVRCSTTNKVNQEIESKILSNLKKYEGRSNSDITERIAELEREWSIERWLELNASSLAFIGVVLAWLINIYWLILPGVVLPFLAIHALQGWCPPLPIMRRMSIRTRREIDWEKFSLKIRRGDFTDISPSSSVEEIFLKLKTN